jgi:hypothetical protein
VQCLAALGTYNIPLTTNRYVYNITRTTDSLFKNGQWPNCTSTVNCGQPPDPPVNGTIQWLDGANILQEGYDRISMTDLFILLVNYQQESNCLISKMKIFFMTLTIQTKVLRKCVKSFIYFIKQG